MSKEYEIVNSTRADEVLSSTEKSKINIDYEILKNKFTKEEQEELEKIDLEMMKNMLAQSADMVRTVEYNWNLSKNRWGLKEDQMKLLYQYNEQHRTPMPENLTDEEKENWDRFNGLNDIPTDEIIKIFGSDHPIMKIETLPDASIEDKRIQDRVKFVVSDFFIWISSLKEYEQIYNAYLKLIEFKELLNIGKLIEVIDKEKDPEKINKMKDSIHLYFYRKYIDFLGEHIKKSEIKRLSNAWNDQETIEYWIQRTRDKLKEMNISSKFILEISQFEKRYLDEKYHKQNNILLMYFMDLVVFHDMNDPKSNERIKATCLIFALDGIIRNTWDSEIKERIMNNILAFEDQFLDRIQ